jgi:mono/diheme cytochrome c family protein
MLSRNRVEEAGLNTFRKNRIEATRRADELIRLGLMCTAAALLLLTTPTLRAQTTQPAVAPQVSADVPRGKAVYEKAGCAGCHGASGQGGSATRIVPMLHPVSTFTTIVRKPPTTAMPALSPASASDGQVADLHAFLRSLSPNVETVAVNQPAGNAENGKKLYAAAACYACHGYVGQGGSAGPRLGPPAVSFAAFVSALRHPREDMPPYTAKVLSDAQVADIYAHVKTFPEPPALNTIPVLKP